MINSRQEFFRILQELKQSEQARQQELISQLNSLKKKSKNTKEEDDLDEEEGDPVADPTAPAADPTAAAATPAAPATPAAAAVDKGQKGKESLEKSKEKIRQTPQSIPSSVNSQIIIDKIDSIRAGSSLKDEKVVNNLKNYIFSLSDSQKKTLYLYLDSLSRIIFANQDSSEVSVPSGGSSEKKSNKKPSKISQAGLPVVSVKK